MITSLFNSPLIANYLFPLLSGVWLAFVTTNLILLRNSKAKAVVALKGLRWEFLRIINQTNPIDLQADLFRLGQPVLDAADELEAHGYLRTSRAFRMAILRLQNPMTERLQTLKIENGFLGANRDEYDKEQFKVVMNRFVPAAMKLIIDETDRSVAMIRAPRTEWLAVAELTALSRFVDHHWKGRRGDPGGGGDPSI